MAGGTFQKRLADHEYEDLLNNWLDLETRHQVERAASRVTPLDDPQHAAIAAESAIRQLRSVRMQIFIAPLIAAGPVYRLVSGSGHRGIDATLVTVMVLLAVWAAVMTSRFRRAALVHLETADWEGVQAVARQRRERRYGKR